MKVWQEGGGLMGAEAGCGGGVALGGRWRRVRSAAGRSSSSGGGRELQHAEAAVGGCGLLLMLEHLLL